MKLWKKLLIAVVVLVLIGVGFVTYGLFQVGKVYTEKIEPDMKRYVQMTPKDQDEYVLSKLADLYGLIYAKDQSGQGDAVRKAISSDPAIRLAGIEWGRAVCASIVKDSKDITANLTDAEKANYKREAENLEEKGERFRQALEKVVPKK
ncbi:MAG: hypothetical protein IJS96_08485 [Schwartzia sp.]|nr:hypothetical protein [Schwartzia sp. (in: firmicutes)]